MVFLIWMFHAIRNDKTTNELRLHENIGINKKKSKNSIDSNTHYSDSKEEEKYDDIEIVL